jgi:hypothetical protein
LAASPLRFGYFDYARGSRSPSRIPLKSIEQVSLTHGIKRLTCVRMVLTYTEDGSRYQRRVNLRSLYTDTGKSTYERARAAFAEHDLYTRGD